MGRQNCRINELVRLSKIELAARITNTFPDFPEGSAERFNAVTNLRNIRLILRGVIARPERPQKPLPVNAGRGNLRSEQRKLIAIDFHIRIGSNLRKNEVSRIILRSG